MVAFVIAKPLWLPFWEMTDNINSHPRNETSNKPPLKSSVAKAPRQVLKNNKQLYKQWIQIICL